MDFQRYRVSASAREPLLRFILDALRGCGCRILRATPPTEAPFRISAEAHDGERFGIIAYAFLATSEPTRNRPSDEHRLQVKYGPKVLAAGLPKFHDLWQDPFGLHTTLLVGINPERGFFVGFDPVLHSPTKFYISLEFKEEQVQQVLRQGWHSWERSTRQGSVDDPVEVVVGGTPNASCTMSASRGLPRSCSGETRGTAGCSPTACRGCRKLGRTPSAPSSRALACCRSIPFSASCSSSQTSSWT
jgi:hypothetical protein